jgi:radical SAM protein with 4Fe4S-binding SPASM domain
MGCRAGLTGIGIDSVGNIRGCESMCDDFFIEGNIRKRSLYEIWNDPDSFSYNRKFTVNQLSGNCRKCEYNTRCAGGCRSYNYFLHGKMYESLRCAKNAINFGNSIFSHKS